MAPRRHNIPLSTGDRLTPHPDHDAPTVLEPLEGFEADDAPTPTTLGRHAILGCLGHGATGSVYRAIAEGQPGEVAIKSLRGLSPEALYRFKREFRALAKIQHPNVVSLHELCLDQDRLYFVMELVEGPTFIEWACGPRPEGEDHPPPCTNFERLRAALIQLVRGVAAIHRAGFLHRDIKPSNVLVTAQGRVVVLDFGLVRDLDVDHAVGLTADGAVLGTPLYMSPEQASGQDTSLSSDWYSVGEILHQALTGKPPYAGLGMIALLAAKKDRSPARPSTLVAGVPQDLDDLAVDLLERDPHRRPTADEILARLGAEPIDPTPEANAASLFVGRDRELRDLREAQGKTRAGRPVVALVEGPSGIGKTALVERLLSTLRTPETVLLAGQCSERESLPYKALDSVIDALASYLRSLPGSDDVRALLPRDVHALARLFPVLLSVPAIAMAPSRNRDEALDPTEARRRGVDALRELLAGLTARSRVALFIDDLQWADHDSMTLLDALLRHPQAPTVLIIGTFHERTSLLGRFIDELDTIEPRIIRHRLELGPLAEPQAQRLAQHLLGEGPNREALASAIATASEGSPLFVTELARYTLRRESTELSSDEEPLRLDDVIQTRVAELSPAARRVLEVVAVAQGRVPLDALPTGDLDAIAELQTERFLRPTSRGYAEIAHDRLRDVVVHHLDAEQRAEIHRRLARALEDGGDVDEVLLAHHYRESGEPEQALHHALRAAEQAAKALAFDRAAALYDDALSIDAVPDDDVPSLLAKLAEALAHAGRLYDSAQAFRRAADHPSATEVFEWKRRAAAQMLASGHAEEGRVALSEALKLVGLELPRSRTRTVSSLVRTRMVLGLRGLNVRLRDPETINPQDLQRLDALWTVSRGLMQTEHLVGVDFQARHLRAALRCGEPIRIARALAAEAPLLIASAPERRRLRAAQLLDEAEALAEHAVDPFARGFVAQARGHVALLQGQFRQSVDELTRAVRIFREVRGASQEVAHCQAYKALGLQSLGRLRELATHASTLLRESLDRTNPYVEGIARGAMAHMVLLAADRVDEAEHQLDLYRNAAPRQFESHEVQYSSMRAAFDRYVDEPERGWTFTDECFPRIRKLDLMRSQSMREQMFLWRASAAVAAARVHAEPEPLLRTAAEAARELLSFPTSYARGFGHLLQAGLIGLRGQSDVATSHLRQAVTAFERHEMGAFLAASKRRLADLLGGTEGEVLREECNAYFQREGVVKPERFTAMLAPGFSRD